MNVSHFNTNTLTKNAIAALKSAYDKSSDKAVKESIVTAFKAIIQLHYELESKSGSGKNPSGDSDFDASEYCAAV